ncbi:MAG: uncharacterized protein QOJ13_2444 [Gaiellales bacterium]|jgi:putative CocE/NonD family hydrolase|nr:uncharacterized protein [Gaiellales bacterium]
MLVIERDIEMRTSDGTVLRADVYRQRGAGELPVLLVRLPYNKATGAMFTYAPPHWFAEQGYMVVVQDTRGRYASDGVFEPLFHEERDSAEAVEWAARLPGCNGRVGTYGGSYLGWVQLAAAVAQPPSLQAIAPAVISPDAHRWAWRNGAFNLHFALSWMVETSVERLERAGRRDMLDDAVQALAGFDSLVLHQPLLDIPLVADELVGSFIRDWAAHPDPADPYWAPVDFTPRLDRIAVPGLHIGGWYDMFVEGTIAAFQVAQAANGRQRLLVGPWYHIPWSRELGCADFGPEAASMSDHVQVRWFDRWLKDEPNGVDEEPPVEVFIMGANTWWRGDAFPPAEAVELSLHLTSAGRANGSGGDGKLVAEPPGDSLPDHFYYEPYEPIPSLGGRSCCFPDVAPMGPRDQSDIHRYPTVLVYDSEPLREPITVLGFVRAEICFDSTVGDTDLVAQLCVHRPDGRVINVIEGIARVRGADGGRVDIELGATGIEFAAGHRVRLMLTSSLFPFYDRNHNNGHRDVDGGPGGTVTAMQTILHDSAHPSRLVLPVVRRA